MNIIQFKRGTSQPSNNSLSDGEFYVNQSTNSLWVGDSTESTGQFQIKSRPSVSDLYNTQSPIDKVAINIAGTGTNNQLAITYLNANGTQSIDYPSVQISGTAENAKKLVKSGGAAYSEGSGDMPVYFDGGVPKPITRTTSSNKIIQLTNGVISERNTAIGTDTRPVYYKANNGFTPITSLSGINVNASRLAVADQKKKMLGTDEDGIVQGYSDIGNTSTPIYINSDGVPSECNISVGGINSQILTTGSNRVQMKTYNNCPFDFAVKTRFSGRVEIDNITVSSGQKLNNWTGSFLVSGCTYAIRCKMSSDTIILFLLDYDSSVRYSCSTSTGTKGLLEFLTLIWDKQNSQWLMNRCQTPLLTNPQWSDFPTNQVTVLSCKQIA